MSVNCLVFGSQNDAWRPLLRIGNQSAYLLAVGSLHQLGSVLPRILEVIQTRPLLSIIGLCGSAGSYGGFDHKCSLPQNIDGRFGDGKREGTLSLDSRVGISIEYVLLSA